MKEILFKCVEEGIWKMVNYISNYDDLRYIKFLRALFDISVVRLAWIVGLNSQKLNTKIKSRRILISEREKIAVVDNGFEKYFVLKSGEKI